MIVRKVNPKQAEEDFDMKKFYKFTFEGMTYYGTCQDKNELLKHATKAEKAEWGKLVSKKSVTAEFVESWRQKAMMALGI